MRVALLVGMGVVFAVIGHPVQHRALNGERSEHGEDLLEPRMRLEGAVREQTMKAHRHPARGEQIEADEQREVGGVDPRVPQEHHGEERAGEWHDHAGEVGGLLGSGHVTKICQRALPFFVSSRKVACLYAHVNDKFRTMG